MRNKYFWAAVFWTAGIAVSCLISMKNFENKGLDLEHKDKVIHGTFYFVFTVLWYLTVKNCNTLNAKKSRLVVFISAVIFGVLIEISQQLFTKDRSADVQDALANSTGSALAVLVLWFFSKIKNR